MSPSLWIGGVSFEEITKEVEKDLIKRALERSGGNKKQGRRNPQDEQKTLYRKMKVSHSCDT